MKKSDQIDICIGKCFSCSPLTQEDIECTKSITQSDLISKHGLNQDQSDCVINWIKNECQRMEAQKSLEPREEE